MSMLRNLFSTMQANLAGVEKVEVEVVPAQPAQPAKLVVRREGQITNHETLVPKGSYAGVGLLSPPIQSVRARHNLCKQRALRQSSERSFICLSFILMHIVPLIQHSGAGHEARNSMQSILQAVPDMNLMTSEGWGAHDIYMHGWRAFSTEERKKHCKSMGLDTEQPPDRTKPILAAIPAHERAGEAAALKGPTSQTMPESFTANRQSATWQQKIPRVVGGKVVPGLSPPPPTAACPWAGSRGARQSASAGTPAARSSPRALSSTTHCPNLRYLPPLITRTPPFPPCTPAGIERKRVQVGLGWV